MSLSYWQKRDVESRLALQSKTEKQIEKQLAKYYKNSMQEVIKSYKELYNEIVAKWEAGEEVAVADLYKMDRYWQLQAQLRNEAQALGDKSVGVMSREFEKQWEATYKMVAIPSAKTFATPSTGAARRAINAIWCADGKNFSSRVWENTGKLVEDLNKTLVDCVITGRDKKELNLMLQEKYGVSFRRAETLIRTETAHIDCNAAAQRYKDYGIEKIEVITDGDCDECEGGIYSVDENPVPYHPNCKCTVVPYFEEDEEAD